MTANQPQIVLGRRDMSRERREDMEKMMLMDAPVTGARRKVSVRDIVPAEYSDAAAPDEITAATNAPFINLGRMLRISPLMPIPYTSTIPTPATVKMMP